MVFRNRGPLFLKEKGKIVVGSPGRAEPKEILGQPSSASRSDDLKLRRQGLDLIATRLIVPRRSLDLLQSADGAPSTSVPAIPP